MSGAIPFPSKPIAPAMEITSQKSTPKRGFLLTITGFQKTSVLILAILSVGYFSFFCTVTLLLYVGRNGTWDTPHTNGERFWILRDKLLYLLNQVHMCSVIPAGIFLPLQFLPAVRRKYPNAHGIAGYLLFTLLGIGSMTGWKMSMTAFGSTLHTQLYGTILLISCTYGTYKSLISIKRLQIDQHRIWVLRTWSYACSILSLRMFLLPTILFFAIYSLQAVAPLNCAQIEYVCYEKYKYNETLLHQEMTSMQQRYPICSNTTIPAIDIIVSVEGKMGLHKRYPEQATALYNRIFGWCGLAGFVVNVVAVEMYIHFTKDETERLKKVSAAKRKALDGKVEETVFKKRLMHAVKEE